MHVVLTTVSDPVCSNTILLRLLYSVLVYSIVTHKCFSVCMMFSLFGVFQPDHMGIQYVACATIFLKPLLTYSFSSVSDVACSDPSQVAAH